MVRAIHAGMTGTLEAIDAGVKETDLVAELAMHAQQALTEILSAVDAININFRDVSTSAGEIAHSVHRASGLVSDVAGVAEENAAAAEEMAAQSVQVKRSLSASLR
jgi:methyl-accepting chemotaxis protein